jgi:hypothetical protein
VVGEPWSSLQILIHTWLLCMCDTDGELCSGGGTLVIPADINTYMAAVYV